ncbi:uncharacterized protein SPPG_03126 [Spizellomyces punctatus DAOM BR117]|uniref:SCP2 domain-containing protein n=1 Tax=Spizellomyces punctatus (strain DAOM BR117) TaxID=645134 RepID=A0A0L0HKF4_SPIPD|nr:uncharacterized protein SPPG_03126 [Spizellomyces punctatus DAOM BR117]KND01314.1 hypothetical protein SPPG_03126 [Spizellomyces punctatus DAOM BR117]|eukprot:XP_016609353.1 hypothetical protein SPPG_03126 [Spizellomyces punctatus DAOM BR117]
MSDLKDKLAEYLPPKSAKPTNASILFPELQRELEADPTLAKNLKGLFIVTVLQKGVKKDEWFLLFKGINTKPVISQTRPTLPAPSKTPLPVILVEIEDADILNFITGGLPALKAYTSQRVRIVGDLLLAQQLEDVFSKAGGPEKAMKYLERVTGKKVSGKRVRANL